MTCRYRKRTGAALLVVTVCVVVLLSLSGCATTSVPSQVPVAVSCVEKHPAKPELKTEEEILRLDDYKAVLAYAAELKKRDKYIGELEDVVDVCERAPSVVTVPR